jgi:hypothetical protein
MDAFILRIWRIIMGRGEKMKPIKKIVCISLLISTLIVPTTSYAFNGQSTINQKNFHTIFNQLLSYFQRNNQSVVKIGDSNIDKAYFSKTTTFYIGDEKFNSKEMEKYNLKNNYNNNYNNDRNRDHVQDHADDDFDSLDIWRDWYCYGTWDWWNWWKKP